MIQINGPPLAFWPVTRYVLSWLKKGRHAATDIRTGKSSLAVEPSHSFHVCFCELVFVMKDCSYHSRIYMTYIPSGAIDTHDQRHKQLIFIANLLFFCTVCET